MLAKPDDLVCVGQIKAPFGVSGWLWIYAHTDPISNIFKYQPWWIEQAGVWRQVTVNTWRHQAKGVVAQLDVVADRTQAESLVGAELYVSKANIPPAGKNEFYWQDLKGLQVIGQDAITQQPVVLGVVATLFETGANDVVVVHPSKDSIDNCERMIPWHVSTIGEIDMVAGTMQVFWKSDY